MVPLSYFNKDKIQLIAVVFPDPFGPKSPKISPSLTSRSVSYTHLDVYKRQIHLQIHYKVFQDDKSV